ncbi:hypothetical protein ASPBRDRAFT_231582 [Aspergillus brasiliensis CBS 101740]|uniref:Uncharacterized protein n=1 Tax=Aspergillus brasiliensis (strain CBS 101740 / IMI 381727 / IBT 21946) TaxID=767769 RepID=A0A1L9UZY9_ASPBC|nr:hypothetical protein ASPBRDRAFT_231582 [Aspergillus brasiliensis CBS 101740]
MEIGDSPLWRLLLLLHAGQGLFPLSGCLSFFTTSPPLSRHRSDRIFGDSDSLRSCWPKGSWHALGYSLHVVRTVSFLACCSLSLRFLFFPLLSTGFLYSNYVPLLTLSLFVRLMRCRVGVGGHGFSNISGYQTQIPPPFSWVSSSGFFFFRSYSRFPI